MNIEEFREYCLSFPAVTEGFPFDETALVMKVKGKMFALTVVEGPFRISLKCDPEQAIELREQYPAVTPGYHFNKRHWNTIEIDGSVEDDLIRQWVHDSYTLVVNKLPKKDRAGLG